MRNCRKSRRCEAGFTFLEVLAALLVAAVALTCALQSETRSLQISHQSRQRREATLLAMAKLQELIVGVEGGFSGSFEEREGWTWEAMSEPVPDGFGTRKFIVTVVYGSGSRWETVTLEQITQ